MKHSVPVVRGEAGGKMLQGVHCQSDRDKVGEYLLCRPKSINIKCSQKTQKVSTKE